MLLESTVHADERGFFLETYRREALPDVEFVQDNHSRSRRGVVRGMHLQRGMGKLVRCARGSIFDVAVDARRGSPSYGEWVGFTLDDVDHRQLWVPDGFAHGFCVLSDVADVVYKTTTYYDPSLETSFAYDDPRVGVEWPLDELFPSVRDAAAPLLS